ncbi:hypothetical protein MMAG44476_32424 [Mycolicibacterium mageritense DSM 44476 = CIP 104973]|uniref:Uncharacterized protein n=1 Tax=Mycolicibacterium mageritense TaxID=53462 RepID=A0ABM7I0Y0_MYCME|nr:hypothetical protein [Mycolicibacterium mageritense]MBN3458672.1 hypothetical protein [Mycobacterium sp. DSM 3803]OKH64087.1 hypothetical protein EB73_24995 [Mycobacterium sp. SWH-M3]MCC9181402.1 hypothetical protein [Mycolicibacterium mageritense]CDO24623.1 hypothetical protein BN978_05119 [Mycolicibacterium mageritense DSM 44476 = CIP 104973]BBX36518.1 hypothetical protein MMAGJ_58000 [Mycolicibacterium mageritense]
MKHSNPLDLVTEAVKLIGGSEVARTAQVLGADVGTADDGTSFLGTQPAPGVYLIQILDRDGDDRIDDIVLRLSQPVALSELVTRLGGYQTPASSGHRQVHDVWFTTEDAVVTARCDRPPGPDSAVVEIFIRPAR